MQYCCVKHLSSFWMLYHPSYSIRQFLVYVCEASSLATSGLWHSFTRLQYSIAGHLSSYTATFMASFGHVFTNPNTTFHASILSWIFISAGVWVCHNIYRIAESQLNLRIEIFIFVIPLFFCCAVHILLRSFQQECQQLLVLWKIPNV